MKSFKLEKTSGDADVTHEAVMWGLLLLFVAVPLFVVFAYFAHRFFANVFGF